MIQRVRNLRGLVTPLFAFVLLLGPGCGDDGDDGDTAGDSTTGGGSTDTNTNTTSATNTTGATSDTGDPPDCDQTDPSGSACTEADNCSISCDCGEGLSATIGACIAGSCDTSPSGCDAACTDAGGSYTDNYCFVGTPSGSDTGSDTSDTSDCTPAGGPCSFSSDCCSDSCDFDDICE